MVVRLVTEQKVLENMELAKLCRICEKQEDWRSRKMRLLWGVGGEAECN